MENKDMPAYPQSVSANEMGIYWATDANVSDKSTVTGLTKREEFAKAAMQGLLSSHYPDQQIYHGSVAAQAVIAADALLAELSKPQP